MLTKIEQIKEILEKIDKELTKKLEIFLIGGGALMFFNAKTQTKDLDVVLKNKEEYDLFKKILIKLDFEPVNIGVEYKKFELSKILVKEDYRFDIFNEVVCGGFFLSKNMINRAKIFVDLKYLKLHVVSLEDIFLFKSLTERDGDIEDSSNILEKKYFNWQIVLNEILHQIDLSGNKVWITYLNERLEILEERFGVIAPIKKEVEKMTEKYYLDLEKKIKNE